MKIKKILRKFTLLLLTVGASLIIGLLSFGGMFALWPVLPLAFATFALSIVYEAEIYWQNIKGAWNKLYKQNFLQRQLAKDYLRESFPDTTASETHEEHQAHGEAEEQGDQQGQDDAHEEEHSEGEEPHEHAPGIPKFFIDYERQLELLHVFGHKRLNKESQARKKRVEKTLRDMEKWFSLQLFAANESGTSEYETTLRDWLNNSERRQKRENTLQLLKSRKNSFWWAKYFSIFAGIFMGLGTTYLLVETFTIIPLFAAMSITLWPILIIPMAAIAGAAYGLLSYNAITDMIADETLSEWLKYLGIMSRATNDASQEHKPVDTVLSHITAWVLIVLALGLTICTAGTWWTVVKETRPLFAWVAKVPRFIMGVINPIITGLSALVFNLQNTRESLEVILGMIADAGKNFWYFIKLIKEGYSELRKHENIAQVFNPFRILLFLTITPLRVLLFLGHLISIGVTADRIPGIPQKFAAFLGFISELFEDLHYFFGHEHAHEHHHEHEHGTTTAHNHEHDHPHGDDTHHEHEEEATLVDAQENAQVDEEALVQEDQHVQDDQQTQEQQRLEHKRKHTKTLLNERLGKGHSHNHDLDIPTAALKIIFTYVIPLYYLSALWDWGFSRRNTGSRESHTPYQLSYGDAAEKMGFRKEKEVALPETALRPSQDWKLTHTVYRIQRYMEKESPTTAERAALGTLQQGLRDGAADEDTIRRQLNRAKEQPVYHGARFFGEAPTPIFLHQELQERVGLRATG